MKRRTYVLALLWWSLLLMLFPPQGMDIDIYRHNAALTLTGQPAFGRPSTGIMDAQDAKYLDYTGLQHAVYVALTALPGGFYVYTLALLLAALWLLNQFSPQAALLCAFLPPLAYLLVGFYWTDKLPFIVLPLLVLYLLRGLTLPPEPSG